MYPQTDDQIIICKESEVAYIPSPRVKLTKGSLVCGLSNRRVSRQVGCRKELSHHTFRMEWTSLTVTLRRKPLFGHSGVMENRKTKTLH